MPTWHLPARQYDLPRDIALLDTNVLIAFVNPQDSWHEHTVSALDLGQFRWVVPHTSLIEAWNFLVGREKRRDLAAKLMAWVLTPGQVIVIGDGVVALSAARDYSERFGIDLVDACLVELADRVTRECGLNPAVHVATFDTGDFLRLFGPSGLSFNVYDMKDISSTSDI